MAPYLSSQVSQEALGTTPPNQEIKQLQEFNFDGTREVETFG